jgi:DNA (cytosine-5)-methyltransferase 1
MLNGLDLFSGIGGITIALKEWVRPIAYCEVDRYAQSVLLSRMFDGDIPRAPIWDDVTSLKGTMLPEIDIIYGGFPCQDLSVAGHGKGLEGKRSGLFFEIVRLASEIRPRYIFLENVPAISVRGLDRVLLELTALGYDSRWTIISASEVGAPHIRERWFLLAHSNDSRFEGRTRPNKSDIQTKEPRSLRCSENMADSSSGRYEPQKNKISTRRHSPFNRSWWAIEPDVGRMANGIQCRVDRLRGLGNAVVPAQAREAFERLMGINTGYPPGSEDK